MFRKVLAGTLCSAVLLVMAAIPASAASPQAFTDAPSYMKDGALYKWAESDLMDAIGLDLFTGYSNGTVRRDLARPFREEPTAPKVAHYQNMAPVMREVQTWPEFRAGSPITRAEFATILARATGLEDEYRAGAAAPFRDTPRDAWYQKYLKPLYDRNVVRLTDYFLDNLAPDQPITRAEIAAWSARALQAKGVITAGAPLNFTDVPDRYQYESELKQAVALGIIKGYPDGRFAPDNTATRAEAAVMVMRMVRQMKSPVADASVLKQAIQDAHDVHTLYQKERPLEQIPNETEFAKYMRPYWTASVVDLRVNPAPTSDNCKGTSFPFDTRFAKLRSYASEDGLLCSSHVAGIADWLVGSLTENHMRTRLEAVHTYTYYEIQDVQPEVVTDRYAVVSVKAQFQTSAETIDFAISNSSQKYYLRMEDGAWKVSGMGLRSWAFNKGYQEPLKKRLDGKRLAEYEK